LASGCRTTDVTKAREDSTPGRGESPTRTVLIVDDESLIRWSLRDRLEASGFAVIEAADGVSALERLRERGGAIGVTVLDLKLPDLDGLCLLTFIKAQHPRCRVILMTAFGSAETAADAVRRGAYRLVTKPFNVDELVALVAESLDATD
jgi:DNA-binding NtrC family response regulator